MKILLIGEYSNVHHSLAEGLKSLGHSVTVVSDGDGWKNYPRDIDISRRSTGSWHTLLYLLRLHTLMPKLKGYDVVQLINPMFLELKAERIWPFYHRLRNQNGSMFMGAYGMDHYWAKAGTDCRTFRYSDFNLGSQLRNNPDTDLFKSEWLTGAKGELNQRIAHDCDGIICGLYEYHASYIAHFDQPEKITHIPFPIIISPHKPNKETPSKVKFFIGIQRSRNAYKGTDIMLSALEKLKERYLKRMEIIKAENVPFQQYKEMMQGSDVILDQLYSYTPAMNALQAMSQGLVVAGGAEPEHYRLMNENELRPIINVQPTEQSVFESLEQLVLHPEVLPGLKQDSIAYVKKHHDHVAVAKSYLRFWEEKMNKK